MLVGKLGGLVRLFAVGLAVVWISAGRGCCGFGVGGLVVVLVGELRALVDSVRWFCMFLVAWHGVTFSCGDGVVLVFVVGLLYFQDGSVCAGCCAVTIGSLV